MGCDQNKFQMTLKDLAMLHCPSMDNDTVQERVFEYFQNIFNQTKEAVDKVVFRYVFPAPLLLLPTIHDNPKAHIMSILNNKSLLQIRSVIDFFLNGYDGKQLSCSLKDVALLQSQVREDYLYQLCTGFLEAKTTAKLGELCKALARFLHSQKPYEFIVKFKNTAEKVLLNNFVIIQLLKENASGYKLEKAKIDKSEDYDLDIEFVCTPT